MQNSVQIVPFSSQYKMAFKALNEAWISHYFKMEASDYKTLDHPEQTILQPGGYIAIALLNDEPVGTCALIKMTGDCYELAKMSVAPDAQGLGIGKQLACAIITQAKQLGAKRLYIESNRRLETALGLYKKLGFKEIPATPSPYERCDIHLALTL